MTTGVEHSDLTQIAGKHMVERKSRGESDRFKLLHERQLMETYEIIQCALRCTVCFRGFFWCSRTKAGDFKVLNKAWFFFFLNATILLTFHTIKSVHLRGKRSQTCKGFIKFTRFTYHPSLL